MSRATMVQGDVYPTLTATLMNDGAAVDLSTATAVKFTMTRTDGTVVINEAAVTVVNAPGGTVRYSWQTSDTATPGRYYSEFEVTFPTGTMTFPNSDRDVVEIQSQLA